jgi:competence protein ComEC
MRVLTTVLFFSIFASPLFAANTLDIYALDSEGKAVLTIAPSGETMLEDLGWTSFGTRPSTTNQVVDSLKALGINRIDHLVISHFDVDHIGDISQLLAAISIGHCYDHGDIQLPAEDNPRWAQMNEASKTHYASYVAACEKVGRTILKPGDKVPIKGVDVEVIHAGGKWIAKPLPGAGEPNPACSTAKQPDLVARDLEDNASIGLLYTYGNFRYYDAADLEGHDAQELVCPKNLIGTVDLWAVNVHGQSKGYSAAMASALKPPVVIEFNDGRMGRGNDPDVWAGLHSLPNTPDIWLLHLNEKSGPDKNPPQDMVANLQAPDTMKPLKISVEKSGTFTITNERNGFSKTYKKDRTAK